MQNRISPGWSWDDLRLFLAAYRRRSLTDAARDLDTHQSTASRRLAQLEQDLGARLFDRVPNGIEPTPVAIAAYAWAEEVERASMGFSEAVAGSHSALRGLVRVALPEAVDSWLVIPAIPAFRQRYPELEIELVASAAIANLARREADVALRLVRPRVGDLVCRRVAAMSFDVWAPEAWSGRFRREVPWVAWDEGCGAPEESAWEASQFDAARRALRVNRIEARLAAVRAGVGAAVLPDALARQVGGLARLDGEVPPPATVWWVTHRGLAEVPRVRVVGDFLTALCAEHLS